MLIQAASILPFRRAGDSIEVLLLHLGGPLWAYKDMWHFAKGELDEGEDDLSAAKREYHEEIGVPLPPGKLVDLGTAKSSNKSNCIWAIEADVDLSQFPATLQTNVFAIEWPPRSGNIQQFPENDRAEWFPISTAYTKVFSYLQVTLNRLAEHLGITIEPPEQQSLL